MKKFILVISLGVLIYVIPISANAQGFRGNPNAGHAAVKQHKGKHGHGKVPSNSISVLKNSGHGKTPSSSNSSVKSPLGGPSGLAIGRNRSKPPPY